MSSMNVILLPTSLYHSTYVEVDDSTWEEEIELVRSGVDVARGPKRLCLE